MLLLGEYRNWTVDQTADAWSFDASVQCALGLPRDRQHMSPRTVNNYRTLLRENELAQGIFEEKPKFRFRPRIARINADRTSE